MDEKPTDHSPPPDPGTSAPFRKDLRRRLAWLRERTSPRALWWSFLDRCEASAAFRLKVYFAAALLGAAGIGGWRYFPTWRENNALRIARQWLDAGKREQAERAVHFALTVAGGRPEAWDLAAEYARQSGLRAGELSYARQAAGLKPDDPVRALAWAAAAIGAGRLDEAATALARAEAVQSQPSALGERVAGEIARGRGDLAAARTHFESSLRLGGTGPESEIPLGLVLVGGPAAERPRGVALLEKWSADPVWGADALRPLLERALEDNDTGRMQRWADALRAHPEREQADLFNSLLALSRADAGRFAAALAEEQAAAGAEAGRVSELVSWLSGVGRGAEAIRWAGTLPEAIAQTPPVAVAVADARRVTGDWNGLRGAVATADWDRLEFVRKAFEALADRQLGDSNRADTLVLELTALAQRNGGQGIFLAGVLYSWGWEDEAVQLWEIVSGQPALAVGALGSLARHYQLARDAEGLFRTFRTLAGLRADEAGIANNFAYLAALLGRSDERSEQAVRTNRERFPDNLDYRATAAFHLVQAGRAAEAVALLEPVAAPLMESPARCLTYGLALAGVGRTAEARTVLARVDRGALTRHEEELVNAILPAASGAVAP